MRQSVAIIPFLFFIIVKDRGVYSSYVMSAYKLHLPESSYWWEYDEHTIGQMNLKNKQGSTKKLNRMHGGLI